MNKPPRDEEREIRDALKAEGVADDVIEQVVTICWDWTRRRYDDGYAEGQRIGWDAAGDKY